MNTAFTPRLYLLGRDYDQAVERIFGKENITMFKLAPNTKFSDKNAEYFADLARYIHGWQDHIVIVSDYETKHLTMLKLSALSYLIFEVKTNQQQDTLEEWFDDYQTFLGWWDSANDFLSAQETLLNNSESMFDDDYYGALYNTNFDLVDMKDRFEEVYREGFKLGLEERFLLS